MSRPLNIDWVLQKNIRNEFTNINSKCFKVIICNAVIASLVFQVQVCEVKQNIDCSLFVKLCSVENVHCLIKFHRAVVHSVALIKYNRRFMNSQQQVFTC